MNTSKTSIRRLLEKVSKWGRSKESAKSTQPTPGNVQDQVQRGIGTSDAIQEEVKPEAPVKPEASIPPKAENPVDKKSNIPEAAAAIGKNTASQEKQNVAPDVEAKGHTTGMRSKDLAAEPTPSVPLEKPKMSQGASAPEFGKTVPEQEKSKSPVADAPRPAKAVNMEPKPVETKPEPTAQKPSIPKPAQESAAAIGNDLKTSGMSDAPTKSHPASHSMNDKIAEQSANLKKSGVSSPAPAQKTGLKEGVKQGQESFKKSGVYDPAKKDTPKPEAKKEVNIGKAPAKNDSGKSPDKAAPVNPTKLPVEKKSPPESRYRARISNKDMERRTALQNLKQKGEMMRQRDSLRAKPKNLPKPTVKPVQKPKPGVNPTKGGKR